PGWSKTRASRRPQGKLSAKRTWSRPPWKSPPRPVNDVRRAVQRIIVSGRIVVGKFAGRESKLEHRRWIFLAGHDRLSYMSADVLREKLTARRFEPFRVRLSNGDIFEVRHPENAMLVRSGILVGVPAAAGEL